MALRKLSAREKRTLSAAAECMLPAGGPFALGHRDVDYLGFIEAEYLANVPREVAQLAHVILFVLEYLGWWFARYPARFSRMAPGRREAALDRLRGSRLFFLRGFFILLSNMLLVPFYRDPRVMDAVGYAGYKADVNKKREAA